jgi:uncharacterized membrane protein YgcG
MKTRNILAIIIATTFLASCTVQQRRVADELYQNPGQQEDEEQVYAGYYDEAEKVIKDEDLQDVDSVIYGEKQKSYENPYDKVLVDNYNEALQRRQNAFTSLSYGMSDWYGTYYSDDFWYASAYDPSFYNVIVMGNDVWVEPNWLTGHFSTGWKYGSFYNYPYYGQSYFNPYRSTLSFTGIYGFNSMGYGAYSYNAYGFSPFGYSSFGYSPYRFSPFGYSSFGYSSYYGMSPFYSPYNNFYNRYNNDYSFEKKDQNQGLIRAGRNSTYSKRVRKEGNNEAKKDDGSKSYVRVNNNTKSGTSGSASVRKRKADTRATSKYIRTGSDNASSRARNYTSSKRRATSRYVRPNNENNSFSRSRNRRYERPDNEANFERVRATRTRRSNNNNSSYSSNRKRSSSTYTNHGSSRRSVSSGSSSSTRSSGSSGSSRSSSSGSSRKRK